MSDGDELLFADLFSGCGGMSLGFQQAGFTPVGAVDNDEAAAETYEENLPISPIVEDIERLPSEHLLESFGVDAGDLDVLISCAPCQGFSQHRNKHDTSDDSRNSLVAYSAELAVEMEPEFFVMENVRQAAVGSERHHWTKTISTLREHGYLVASDVVNAANYGVPQRRNRAILMARKEGRYVDLPEPTTTDNPITVRDAIDDLPSVSAGESHPADEMHRAPDHTQRIIEMIDHIPHDGGSWLDIPEPHQEEYWLDSMKKRVEKGDTSSYIDTYGRMHWDKPAPTITRKSSSPSCGRFVHPEQNRNITPREAARLQTFPDDWTFKGSLTDWYAQNGNAVPPLLARRIATHIRDLYSVTRKGARQMRLDDFD